MQTPYFCGLSAKKKECVICGKLVTGRGVTCSMSCRGAFAYRNVSDKSARNRKISISKIGANNPQWKGNHVSKRTLHKWGERWIPKPSLCEGCRSCPPLDLANISQEYKRDVTDWQWLCRKCHMASDGRLIKLQEYNEAKKRRYCNSGLLCALCRSPVIRDKWTQVTHSDHDGNPVEESGHGYYCTNEKCEMHLESLEDEQMLCDDPELVSL